MYLLASITETVARHMSHDNTIRAKEHNRICDFGSSKRARQKGKREKKKKKPRPRQT